MAGFVVLVAVPLGVGSYQVFAESTTIAGLRPVAEQWAAAGSWQLVDVSGTADAIRVEVLAHLPQVTTRRGTRGTVRPRDDTGEGP